MSELSSSWPYAVIRRAAAPYDVGWLNGVRCDVFDARDGWRSRRITVDGIDVVSRCRSVWVHGEQPVAAECFGSGFPRDENGHVIVELLKGAVEVAGLRKIERPFLLPIMDDL